MPKMIYKQKMDVVNNYWHDYGFFRDPFSISDVESFFNPLSWEEYLDFLSQSIQYSNRLPFIIGEEGSGKTSFAKLLQHRLQDSTKVWRFTAEKTYDPIKFFSEVVQQFGLDAPIFLNSAVKQKISLLLDIVYQTRKKYLIIIDEAQNLPSSMLEIILDLMQKQMERTTNLHIVLLGSSALESQIFRVAHYKGCDGILHNMKLKPWSLQETEFYVRHCFCESGQSSQSPVNTINFDSLYRESQGYVKRINWVAKEFLRKDTNAKEESKTSFLRQHQVKLVAGVSLALVMGLSMIVYNHLNNGSVGRLVHGKKNASVAHVQEITFDAQENTKIENPKASSPQEVIIVKPETTPNQTQAPVSWNDIFENFKLENQFTKPVLLLQNTITPLLVSHSILKQTFDSEKMLPSLVQEPSENQETIQENIAEADPTDFNNTNIDLDPAMKQKILSVDGQAITIQLMASEDEMTIQQFVQQLSLPGQPYYYRTLRGNKFWYIVVYGQYATKQEAYAMLKQLPANAKTLHPWLRLYSSVQGEIRT